MHDAHTLRSLHPVYLICQHLLHNTGTSLTLPPVTPCTRTVLHAHTSRHARLFAPRNSFLHTDMRHSAMLHPCYGTHHVKANSSCCASTHMHVVLGLRL